MKVSQSKEARAIRGLLQSKALNLKWNEVNE